MSDKTLTEQDVLDVILKVFEVLGKRHAAAGRHELNRTTLAEVIQELKIVGVPQPEKTTEELFDEMKRDKRKTA